MEGISFEISDEEWTDEEPSTEGYPDPITPTPPDAPSEVEATESERL